VSEGRKEGNVFRQPGENMVALKKETVADEIRRKTNDPENLSRAKFRVFGEEMIEKEVKPAGNTGRIYLPMDWVGKHVKIIRID
jgi:hypothetical protein